MHKYIFLNLMFDKIASFPSQFLYTILNVCFIVSFLSFPGHNHAIKSKNFNNSLLHIRATRLQF